MVSLLSKSKTSLNSEFSFSKIGCHAKIIESNLCYNLRTQDMIQDRFVFVFFVFFFFFVVVVVLVGAGLNGVKRSETQTAP